MESKVYNQKGEEVKKVKLPEEIFGLPQNDDLVHQVTLAYMANARTTVAHTKGRSEVRGGGIKPWRQKGTGRARHGSRRSPIWVGGGITHGPHKDKDYSQKINKKMKTKALFTVLSNKLRDGEILFIDELSFSEPKAKEAKGALESLSKIKGFEDILNKRKNSAFIAIPEGDANILKSFGNFGNLEIDEVRNLNILDILRFKYLVISGPEKSLETLESKINKKSESMGSESKKSEGKKEKVTA